MILAFAFCSPIPRVCCLENYFGNVGTECDTRLHYYHISMVQKGEQFLELWWFASNGIGTIVGLAIAYGLFEMMGTILYQLETRVYCHWLLDNIFRIHSYGSYP